MSEKKKDYAVGYKKPPKFAQFKPGKSGNPKGRRKGMLNLRSDLEEELAELINVREGDRHLKVSKQRAMIKALVAKSLKGDVRSAAVLVGLIAKHIEPRHADKSDQDLSVDDVSIINSFLSRQIETPAPTVDSNPNETDPKIDKGQKNDQE